MPAPTFELVTRGTAPNQYAQESDFEGAVNAALAALWADVIAAGGKQFASRAAAVSAGQTALPTALGMIVTMENGVATYRAPNSSTDDPLFPGVTAPYWGVVSRGVPSISRTVTNADGATNRSTATYLTPNTDVVFNPNGEGGLIGKAPPNNGNVTLVNARMTVRYRGNAVLQTLYLNDGRVYEKAWLGGIEGAWIEALSASVVSAEIGNATLVRGEIIQDASGKTTFGVDAAGNLFAGRFRETHGLDTRQQAVTLAEEALGNVTLASSGRGSLMTLAPETLDEAGLRDRFSGPWTVESIGWRNGEAVASALWMGQRIPLALAPGGFPYARNARAIKVILGLGQSQQGLGSTGMWTKFSLAPAHAFLFDTHYTRSVGAQTPGFGSIDGSQRGEFTASGLIPFRNVPNAQSLIDPLASRLALEQCADTGIGDLYVTMNVSAGGANIAQCGPTPPNSEPLWQNTLRAIQETARLATAMALPVELIAADFRQGYADRTSLSSEQYYAALAAFEEAFAAAVAAALPGNRRPYFILQQVTDATREPQLDGEGPALAQMRYLRANPHGNVVEVPATVGEDYEDPAINIHLTERHYAVNGELAALALRSVLLENAQRFGGWPISDSGSLAGAVASYTLSAARALVIEPARIAGSFKALGTAVPIQTVGLTHIGMDGPRWLYRVEVTFAAIPTGLTAILHGQPYDVTPPGYGSSAIRAAEVPALRFTTRAFHTQRFADYATYAPGVGPSEPRFVPVYDWIGLHKIIFS